LCLSLLWHSTSYTWSPFFSQSIFAYDSFNRAARCGAQSLLLSHASQARSNVMVPERAAARTVDSLRRKLLWERLAGPSQRRLICTQCAQPLRWVARPRHSAGRQRASTWRPSDLGTWSGRRSAKFTDPRLIRQLATVSDGTKRVLWSVI